MNVVEKLTALATDEGNEFAQVVRESSNFNILNEKLHSLAEWFRVFMKSYEKYDLNALTKGDIDSNTIELINYISICNGILDVADGLEHVANEYFKSIPKREKIKDFSKTRKANEKHDEYFKFKKDDRGYFKHIRAAYGQHPSDLRYQKGPKGFASWAFGKSRIFRDNDSDLNCNIYFDQDIRAYGYKFHIYFEEIKGFTETQIDYIDVLIDFMNDTIKSELENMCGKIEEWDDGLSLENKLHVLKEEIQERYVVKESHYLLEATNRLETMLQTHEIQNYKAEYGEYLLRISESVDEIYNSVLKCEQNELPVFNSFDSQILNAVGNHYYKEKVAMYLIGDYLYHDIFKEVMDIASRKLNLPISHSKQDFFLYFYLLGSNEETAVNESKLYQPNKYTVNTVLGIDAAWTNGNPSGVCLLTDDSFKREILRLSSSYEGFIKGIQDMAAKPLGAKPSISSLLEACEDYFVDCIAVDMPLSNELITGRRSSEKTLSEVYGEKGASAYTPNKDMPGEMALDIVNQALESGYRLSLVGQIIEEKPLIEVYPHASIIEYLDLDYRLQYKVDKRNTYSDWKELEPLDRKKRLITNLNLLIERIGYSIVNVDEYLPLLDVDGDYKIWQLKAYEDMIDATYCALTGLSYISGNITGYGGSDGTIWVTN